MNEIKRNDPCHCGNGRKYKRCHLIPDWHKENDHSDALWDEYCRNKRAEREKLNKQVAEGIVKRPLKRKSSMLTMMPMIALAAMAHNPHNRLR